MDFISEDQIEEIIRDLTDLIMKDYRKAISRTTTVMTNELNDMYKTFIDQFYQYKTTSYIRHWEGYPGTGHGQNLYFGNDISRTYSADPEIDINFSGAKMDGGYPYSIDRNHPEVVLEKVMSGIRFPYKRKKLTDIEKINKKNKARKYNSRYSLNWKGQYKGKYFKYKGVMQDAFDQFEKEFDDIAETIFYEEWAKLGW